MERMPGHGLCAKGQVPAPNRQGSGANRRVTFGRVQPSDRLRRRQLTLLAGILTGPASWCAGFGTSHALAGWASGLAWKPAVYVVCAVALGLAGAAGVASWIAWGRLGYEWPGEPAAARLRFLAIAGVLISAMSFLIILVEGIAVLALGAGEAAQPLVDVAERGELTQVGHRTGARRHAAGMEIAAIEEIGCGDYGSAHGPVLVSTLRPGQFAVEPEVETHRFHLSAPAGLPRMSGGVADVRRVFGPARVAVACGGADAHLDAIRRYPQLQRQRGNGFTVQKAAVDL